MVFSNVIVDVTVPRRSSVFSQSSVQISAGLTDISGLAVAAFDLINCPLSVPRFTKAQWFCSKMGEPKYRFDILKDLIFSRASFY